MISVNEIETVQQCNVKFSLGRISAGTQCLASMGMEFATL